MSYPSIRRTIPRFASRRASRSHQTFLRLSMEALEPRCLLAGDLPFVTPENAIAAEAIEVEAITGEKFPPENLLAQKILAEVETPSTNAILASGASHSGFTEPADPRPIPMTLINPSSPGNDGARLGDTLHLRVHLSAADGNVGAPGTRLVITYDSQLVQIHGFAQWQGSDGCDPVRSAGTGQLDFSACLPTQYASPLIVEIPFAAVGLGTASFSVQLMQEDPRGGVGSLATVRTGTTEAEVSRGTGLDPLDNSRPEDPPTGSRPWVIQSNAAGTRSSNWFSTRSLTPKASLTDSVSRSFTISLVPSEIAPHSPSASTVRLAIRPRAFRSSSNWSLSEDVTANLLRSLESANWDELSSASSPSKTGPPLLPRPRHEAPAHPQQDEHPDVRAVRGDPGRAVIAAEAARHLLTSEPVSTPVYENAIRIITPAEVDSIFAAWQEPKRPLADRGEASGASRP